MKNDKDVESQLHDLGVPIGLQVLELASFRDKALPNNKNICQYGRRETKFVNVLHFINNQVWKLLFNRTADGIELAVDDESHELEYRIIDQQPLTNAFISATSEQEDSMGPNCASFLAGIIEGVLNAS